MRRWILGAAMLLTACGAQADGDSPNVVSADIPVPETVAIPAGDYIGGSSRAERDRAYRLDEAAYGHTYTRDQGWYEDERARDTYTTEAFEITRTLITNRHYAAFVEATGHRAPDVDRATWDGYGLIHPYERTRRFAWSNGTPPAGRGAHPVVLVRHRDARAYAAWLRERTGDDWRLPTENQWEKAARGRDGRLFPWGDTWDPTKLNSHDAGPFDTLPVGSFPEGASPFGLLDPAGQVFEWMADSYRDQEGRFTVKGGSWDDKGCGVCRPASRHGRPVDIKHILVGFRLVKK